MSTIHKDHRDILIAPVVSEKSYGLLDDNKYTFVVHPDANKTEIKIAVEKIFGVKVTAVNTINRKGKTRRTRNGSRQAQGHQASHRQRRRRPEHRHLRRPERLRRGLKTYGNSQVQADNAGPSWLERCRLRRDHPHDVRRSR